MESKVLDTLKTSLAIFGASTLIANLVTLPEKTKKEVQSLLDSGDIEGVKKIAALHDDMHDKEQKYHDYHDQHEYKKDQGQEKEGRDYIIHEGQKYYPSKN